MVQQVLLVKERRLFFGYKKPVPIISTSCAPHCEKSQLRKIAESRGAGKQRGWFPVFVRAGTRTKRGENETDSFNDRRFVVAACGDFYCCIGS
jgi:hypothetical protein